MKPIKSFFLSSLFLAVIFIAGCNEAPITSNENVGSTNYQKLLLQTLHIFNTSANMQTVNIYAVSTDWDGMCSYL